MRWKIDFLHKVRFIPAMRILVYVAAVLLAFGCAKTKNKSATVKTPKEPRATAKAKSSPSSATETNSAPVVTPDYSASGRVAHVNTNARFAVLTFTGGVMPARARPLFVYRNGLKVGELRVTGPQEGNSTVADILNGDVQKNDDVREN